MKRLYMTLVCMLCLQLPGRLTAQAMIPSCYVMLDSNIAQTPTTVDFEDFFAFAESFGKTKGMAGFNIRADVDENGFVDEVDYLPFSYSFGKTCAELLELKPADEVTLIQGISAFSLSSARKILYPYKAEIMPDILVSTILGEDGKIIGAYLVAPDFPVGSTFALIFPIPEPPRGSSLSIRQSSIEDSARKVFDNLKQFPIVTYTDLAIPVLKNQVWVVKTRENNYAKLLILDVKSYEQGVTHGVWLWNHLVMQ